MGPFHAPDVLFLRRCCCIWERGGNALCAVPLALLCLLGAVLLGGRNGAADVPEAVSTWESNILSSQVFGDVATETLYEEPAFRSAIPRDQIGSVTFLDTVARAGENAWDASLNQDQSVLALADGRDGLYDLYIAGEGGVSAPEQSTDLFRGFANVERIDFGDSFHTENAASMERMFNDCFALESLDLGAFVTSKVQNMSCMFYQCTALKELDAAALGQHTPNFDGVG